MRSDAAASRGTSDAPGRLGSGLDGAIGAADEGQGPLRCSVGHGRMGFWAAVLLVVAGAAVLLVALEYWFVTLTLVAAPYLLAAVTRRAEVRADHHAAAAGFGPTLAEVLHMMQAADRESGSVTASALSGCGKTAAMGTRTPARARRQGPLGKLLSTHPDYHTRLHHLAPPASGRTPRAR